MSDHSVKRIRAGPDDVGILGHSSGFGNETHETKQFEATGVDAFPMDRPIGYPTFSSRTVAQAKPGDPMTHPGQLQRNFAKTPETVVDEIFEHILAFGQYENVQVITPSIIWLQAV